MSVLHVLTAAIALVSAAPPYAPHVAIVSYHRGVVASAPFDVDARHLEALRGKTALADADVPAYTNDARTNRMLVSIGVVRVRKLMPVPGGEPAYRLELLGADVRAAVEKLRALPTVAYASPDWFVSPMNR